MRLPYKERDLERLASMLDAAERIARYMDGVDKTDFLGRDMVFDAVCLNLVRIGEGGKFLSADLKEELSAVHWPDVITMRNRIAHGYRTLEETIIWMTAIESVPALAVMVRNILQRED
jgi:uncharacterized protein with HEPN domain